MDYKQTSLAILVGFATVYIVSKFTFYMMPNKCAHTSDVVIQADPIPCGIDLPVEQQSNTTIPISKLPTMEPDQIPVSIG